MLLIVIGIVSSLVLLLHIDLPLSFNLFKPVMADSNSCHLPNECQLIKPYDITDNFPYTIKCSLTQNGFNPLVSSSNGDDSLLQNCDIHKNRDFLILFYPETPLSNYIFDERFHFENLKSYIRMFNKSLGFYIMRFNYVHGFQVNTMSVDLSSELFNDQYTTVTFYKSQFDFYINSVLVESCEHLIDSNLTSPRSSIFQIFRITRPLTISFSRCEYKRKVCPLLFNNSNLFTLVIDHMIDSFVKTNVLTFFHLKRNLIYRLRLLNIENIELNRDILNEHVFKSLVEIYIEARDLSIELYVFRAFKKLKKIYIAFKKKSLIKSIGIEWTKYLNEGSI